MSENNEWISHDSLEIEAIEERRAAAKPVRQKALTDAIERLEKAMEHELVGHTYDGAEASVDILKAMLKEESDG